MAELMTFIFGLVSAVLGSGDEGVNVFAELVKFLTSVFVNW